MTTPTSREVTDPTGEIVDLSDPDAVMECVLRVDELLDKIEDFKRGLTRVILDRTADIEARTKRLRGERFVAKIEMPNPTVWDRGILKRAWKEFPALAQTFLRIDSVAVNLIEYRKAQTTKGTPEFEKFAALVESAKREAPRPPSVKIERLPT